MASQIPLRGDMVVIEKIGGNAELVIKNGTRTVDGFLWNQGEGKSIFKKVMLDITSVNDLDLYGRNQADYILVTSNNSIYAWRATGIPDDTTVFDADDDGVWVLVAGLGGNGAAPYFEKVLPAGNSLLIPKSEHNITNVRGAKVLTPTRVVMDVYTEIRENDDVFIDSNINLNNYILKIY